MYSFSRAISLVNKTMFSVEIFYTEVVDNFFILLVLKFMAICLIVWELCFSQVRYQNLSTFSSDLEDCIV
jgi:hypothetical protein